jgi:hypothetical protein
LEVLILTALRAYAVGAAFSVRDVADEWAWRPTDHTWTDVEYRRPRARTQPTSDNQRTRPRRRAASAVSRRVDPSRIRTPEQRRAAGLRVCNG